MTRETELVVSKINEREVISRLNQLHAKLIGVYNFKRVNFQLITKYTTKSPNYYTSWVRIRTRWEKDHNNFKGAIWVFSSC